MRKLGKSGGECIGRAPALPHIFRHVYHFILKAVGGDVAAATAIFQGYLAGELSEELLKISRRWVNKDQAGGVKREPKKDWAGEEPRAVLMRSKVDGFRRLSPPPRVTETVPAPGEKWSPGATFDRAGGLRVRHKDSHLLPAILNALSAASSEAFFWRWL
jgi:hypothetical protein